LSILIVDNGSEKPALARFVRLAADQGLDLVDEPIHDRMARPPHDQEIMLVTTGRNLGYAGGNNGAFRCAMEWGFDWILVLNNDTRVPANLVEQLLASAASRPKTGLVGCKVVPLGESTAPIYKGGHLLYALGVYALLRWRGRKGSVSVNFVPGCALLVRRKLLDDIGLFDERFFLYTEDVDLSYRALKAGWELLANLDVQVEHGLSASLGGRRSALYYYYVTRNTIVFIWTRLPGPTRLVSLAFFLVQTAGRCALWLPAGRFRHVRAVGAGLVDAIAGKTGEAPRDWASG
jgi:GT2 family glycosyltransferase